MKNIDTKTFEISMSIITSMPDEDESVIMDKFLEFCDNNNYTPAGIVKEVTDEG